MFSSNGQEKREWERRYEETETELSFHNPNTAEVTADYILKVFVEANMKKVERAMQEAAKVSAKRGQAE